MLFCTKAYLIFFAIVFSAYWVLPWARARVWILLAASFYFYASWNKWLALIICISTTVDYVLARAMEQSTAPRWRKLCLTTSIVGNLGLLVYFKYSNFFLHSLERTLHALGDTSSLPVLKVILPIGISFYTFEAISYTVDVYRRRIPAERNLLHFMLFITFFPHLVAGPIVRARDFLPQVRRPKHWDWARLHLGLQVFLVGVVKKLVIADRMAVYADPVFAIPTQFGTGAIWLAVLAYAIQIYCDFSGYTDMAIGTAHMLGYKLAINFNMPYLSANVSEFWRRWHISLSSWLRDYLFIPLGGSRGSRWKTARNLIIVMTLGGLWHGAAMTFIVWGILHGLFLIIHRAFRAFCEARPTLNSALLTPPGWMLRAALTFLSVCLAWVFFRAPNVTAALTMLRHMFPIRQGSPAPVTYHCLATLFALVLLCHLVVYSGIWRRVGRRIPAQVLGAAYAFMLTAALALTPYLGKVFIYFQF
jgi:alginate O-acetyltransferase complex protein AlgI